MRLSHLSLPSPGYQRHVSVLFNSLCSLDPNVLCCRSLNIFNSRLVIASPSTSTDLDYSRVEGVVAHE